MKKYEKIFELEEPQVLRLSEVINGIIE